MRRFVSMFTACVILCGLLSGCNIMDGHYSSVKPHLADEYEDNKTAISASSYVQLRQAMVDLVKSGTKSGVITINGIETETLEDYIRSAIEHVTKENAVGAYAVDQIQYDVGTNAGLQAVAVNITYTHEKWEILRIRQVEDIENAKLVIYENLDKCTSSVVIQIADYEETDFVQLVEDYARSSPDAVMELPQVSVMTYPEQGKERVVELVFTYQNSREDLREMQEKVLPIFTASQLYVRETRDQREKYVQLYSLLMERFEEYTVQPSITPAYSLLMYGVGDSKAFADVYAAMCSRAGIPCYVVSGTKNGEAWFWNMIVIDGVYYHVDLLRCAQTGAFRERTNAQMSEYVWDYSAFEIVDDTME